MAQNPGQIQFAQESFDLALQERDAQIDREVRPSGRRLSKRMIVAPLFLFLERALRWINNGATSVIQGLSLGILSNIGLERLTEHRYSVSFSSFAEESYLNSGLFIWEQAAIR